MNHKRVDGVVAENLATSYLLANGLVLCGRNFHSRFGEIDIIMQDKDGTVVFIEVRQRNSGHSAALESINYAKQKKLVQTAKYYLSKYATGNQACRFDVVAINGMHEVLWFKNVIML